MERFTLASVGPSQQLLTAASPLPPWQQGTQNPGLPSFAFDVNSVKEKRVIELAFQIERKRRAGAARNALWCEVFSP